MDIYPTLIDLCQPAFRKTEYPLDGKSLKPILTGEETEIREAALSYWNNAVSVRTQQYRMTASMKRGKPTKIELYDITENPDPVENLAKSEPKVVEKLSKFLPGEK